MVMREPRFRGGCLQGRVLPPRLLVRLGWQWAAAEDPKEELRGPLSLGRMGLGQAEGSGSRWVELIRSPLRTEAA